MVKKDRLQMSIEVDGKQGINELGKLEMEARDLQQTMKGLKKDTEEYKAMAGKLDGVINQTKALRQELGLTGMTLKQLGSYQRDLQTQWNTLTRGTEAWKQVDAELKKVNSTIAQQKAELKGTSGVWGFLKSEIGKFGTMALAFLGFDALIGKMQNLIAHAAKLSDAMADVRMTTGMTAAAMQKYEQDLKGLNTRTSKEDLLGIGKIAGQFGVARNELRSFTDTMNKVVVVMKSEFSGGAEEVTDRMATLRNIFTDIKSGDIATDISHISNAVLTLAQEGVATAPVVTDFANRIGGVGINLGLTTPQVLGLSATMQELGITAERGGTAVGKILQKMTTNTSEFAKVAGMDLQKFSNLVNNDIYTAFLKVLEGSKKGGEGAVVLGRLIKDLEISGAGASEVFSKLGNNMDTLAGRVKLAGDSIRTTTNITEQYNLKNETFAGNLERVQKVMAAWFANGALMRGIQDMVGWLAKLTEVKFSDTLQQEQAELNVLVSAITNANDGYGTRAALLKELQDKYPDFLGNLDAEKVTNEQLQVALDAVNREYLKKIFLAKNQETLNEMAERELELRQQLFEQNKKLQQAGTDFRVQAGGEVRRIADDIQLDINLTKRAIDELSKERAKYMMEQNALAKELGLNPNLEGRASGIAAGKKIESENMPGKKPGNKNAPIAEDDEAKKKAEKERQKYEKMLQQIKDGLAKIDDLIEQNGVKRELSLLEKQKRELAIIDEKYSQELLKAGQNWQSILSNDQLKFADKIRFAKEAQDQLDALEAQWKAERDAKEAQLKADEELKRQALVAQIQQMTMSETDWEIQETVRKYEALIAEAEKYGLDYTGLYQAMVDKVGAIQMRSNKELIKEDRKTAAARIQAHQALENAIGGLFSAIGQMMSDDAEFQRMVTIAQIAIDTAAAISATSVQASKNPANATTFGAAGAIQLATGIARVLAVAAQAKQSTNVTIPEYPQRGFSLGGETGSKNPMGQDSNGKVMGVVHSDEYVIPAFVRHLPAVINLTRIVESQRMEAISTGQTNGNYVSNSSAADPYSARMDQMERMMMMQLQSIEQLKSKPVVFYKQEYDRFNEIQDSIEFSAQR